MKRSLKRVFTALFVCVIGFALAGCEQIGIGDEGSGVPQTSSAKVSAPAIEKDGVLRVGVDGSNAPFSTMLGDKLVGIDVDIALALCDELGVKAEIVDVGAEPETALAAGTVDIIMGIDTADTAATCWKSSPYIDTAVGIFATSSGAILPTPSSKPVIEAQESSMSAWEVTNQFGEDALQAVSDLRTAFEDLENGKVTYVASDAIIGSYVTHSSGGRAMLIGLMQTPGGYCVGADSTNSDLISAVEAAVSTLVGKGVSSVVEAKWIGTALSLNNIAFTDFSNNANLVESESESRASSVGKVGSNAVDLKNNDSATNSSGSTGGESAGGTATAEQNTTPAAPAVTETAPAQETYTEPAATHTEPAATYTDSGTTDQTAANTGTDTTYVEPVAEAPAEGAGTGTEAATEPVAPAEPVDTGAAEAPAADAAPVEAAPAEAAPTVEAAPAA